MTERMNKGAVRFAATLDRRRFIRRVAGTAFAGFAGLAAGGVPGLRLGTAMGLATNTCNPRGPGCPVNYGCGTSPCCNATSRPVGCRCGLSGARCKNVAGSHCHGRDTRFYAGACWSCTLGSRTTTCCDCRTSTCGDPYPPGRCISWRSVVASSTGTYFVEDNDTVPVEMASVEPVFDENGAPVA